MKITLLSLVSIFSLFLSMLPPRAQAAEDRNHSAVKWFAVERSEHAGCRVIDQFEFPSLKQGLCIARVYREVLCDDKLPSNQTVLDFAGVSKRGRSCDKLIPSRDFVTVDVVRLWEDAPVILSAAGRLLERLPRESKRYGLSTRQAHALRGAGISALRSIDFDIGETFGPDTLRLLFDVEECNCDIILLMDKNRINRYDWALLIE